MNLARSLSSRKNLWLFSIIFIEGYVVLASELLAIRLLVPFVGSGTDTVSIVISAVLLPLAIGYHMGSSAFKRKSKKQKTLRDVLASNLLKSMLILCFGLSFYFLEFFFAIISELGAKHALLQAALYSLVFLVYPVYLMGQTIPIISNYFSRQSLSEATGAMLFFSTIGSFLGSVFSTLFLMMVIGVNNTVIFTLFLLFVGIAVVRQKISFEVIFAALLWLMAYSMNSDKIFARDNVYSNNAYSIVSVKNAPGKEDVRVMSVNRSPSSQIGNSPADRFKYIAYIEDYVIFPYDQDKQMNILVIGAGGFTLGATDEKNNYTYVDIDPALKEVSEKYMIRKKLGGNKRFVAASARAFLAQNSDKYDLVVVDAYSNVMTMPAECVTKEFFEEIRNDLAAGGVVVANIVNSAAFGNKFSVRLFNTFASVFPQFNKQVINNFTPWDDEQVANNLYIYIDNENVGDREVYTDDKNSYAIDRY